MDIGFTGSREGLTKEQANSLAKLFIGIRKAKPNTTFVLHHGDCVGADAAAHKLAENMRWTIIVHPPTNNSKRAYCSPRVGEVLPSKDYISRNRDIVNNSLCLIACPNNYSDPGHGGTWSTIRYAKSVKRVVIIVFPDGNVDSVNV